VSALTPCSTSLPFTRLKASDFQNAKVSLKDAIKLAEQKSPGSKAYEAEVEREGNAVEYEINGWFSLL
jgi:uncharacterized membrane protein YkoI